MLVFVFIFVFVFVFVFLFVFGFHGTLWFYSGISVVALLYGFYFMPDYSRWSTLY